MPPKKIYANAHERQRAAMKRRREREGWAAKPKPTPTPKPLTTDEARAIYHDEKAKWLKRTAQARAELEQRCRDAVAKADAEALVQRRGGRPKGSKNRGPSIAVFGRSKLDLLRESRPGGTL